MSDAETGQASSAVHRLMARIAEWWRRDDISGLPADEVDRVAHDLAMAPDMLREIAAKGPGAADLLYERMAALGVYRADVDRIAVGLMRDLERDCACCADKAACAEDLANRPHDPRWTGYCPNAATLQALERTRGRALI
jgi:hypothetical protein